MSDDTMLLRRYAADHDEAAFVELVRRHVDAVYSAALRRVGGDVHLAQDVTQQVFVALGRKAAAVAGHPMISAWLYRTTRNEAANVVRTECRRKAREQQANPMNDMSSENGADWSRLAPVLDAAIDELNESDRRAVLLRYIERQSFAQIGVTLRISEDAARMKVDRALGKLRPALARRGVASTASALSLAFAQHAVSAAPASVAPAVIGAALTAAPTAALSLAAVIELMSTTKTIAIAMSLLVVLAASTATREALALSEAEQSLAAANEDAARHRDLLQQWHERAAVVEQATSALQAKLEAAKIETTKASQDAPRPSMGAAARSTGRPTPESIAAGKAFIARHPELQRAIFEYHHATSATSFAGFYKAHGFSPTQIEQFENALMGDAGVFRMIQSKDGELMVLSTPTWGDREKRRQEEQAMVALLGRDGIQDLQVYLRQLPARRLTTQLAGDLYYTPTPLTPGQAEQLVSAIGQVGGGRTGDGNYDWDTIFAAAKDVLSEPQLAALRAYQASLSFDQALAQAMRRASPSTIKSEGQNP